MKNFVFEKNLNNKKFKISFLKNQTIFINHILRKKRNKDFLFQILFLESFHVLEFGNL